MNYQSEALSPGLNGSNCSRMRESSDWLMVALARGMLYEPHWAWRAAAELGGEVRAPKQYWRAPPRGAEAIFRDAKVGQR